MFEGIGSTEHVLEGYRITYELAPTASCRVVLGESVSPNTPHQRVSIKWFLTRRLTTQQEIDYFHQETNTLSGLLHPFILPILSAGMIKTTPYIIEAYASNGSLQDRLQHMPRLPFSLENTITILTQLGQALYYIHQHDVIHGNLQPENILFNDKGDALLANFSLHSLATQLDKTSSIYQAPELLPGHASQQGDQYALGCIAYEMITGYKPFLTPSPSKPDTFYRTKTLISPKHFNPALSSRSEEAILKAIAKEPAQRHGDISCFIAALGTLSNTGDQTTSTAIEEVETLSTLNTSQPDTLADYISQSPDRYPFAHRLLDDANAANHEATIYAPAHAEPFGTNSTKPFFKRRWIRIGIVCLVAVCIIAVSLLTFSISPSAQGHKPTPTRDTTIDLSSPSPCIHFV